MIESVIIRDVRVALAMIILLEETDSHPDHETTLLRINYKNLPQGFAKLTTDIWGIASAQYHYSHVSSVQ